MDIIFIPFISVVIKLIEFYQLILIIYVILSWLESLHIINSYNQIVYNIHSFLFAIVEPILSQIRRILPDLGPIDLSPLVLFFILYFIIGVMAKILERFPS
ncbi:MAG: YggT family protein [Alphaproteobacteria bacterium]